MWGTAAGCHSVVRARDRYNLRKNPRSLFRRCVSSLRSRRHGHYSPLTGRWRRRRPREVNLTSRKKLDSPELAVPLNLQMKIRIKIENASLHFQHVGYLEIDGEAHAAGRLVKMVLEDINEEANELEKGDFCDLGKPIERGDRMVKHIRRNPKGLLQYDDKNPSHVVVNNRATPGDRTNMDVYGVFQSSPLGEDAQSYNLLYLGFQQEYRERFWLGTSPGDDKVMFWEVKGPFSADYVMAKENFRWLLRNVEHTGSSLVFQLENETVGKLLVPRQTDGSLILASPATPGVLESSFFEVPHF